MKLWEHYYTPRTFEEASDLLARHGGAARVVGGGTDLLLEIKQGHRPPVDALVDVTHIDALKHISQEDDHAIIGAAVTHNQIVRSEMLTQRATCLVESCGVVGGPQVRNVGTLAGNVAHALPAADGTTSLVALDAEVEVYHNGSIMWVPIQEMFQGPGQSLLDSTRDLLLRFRFRLTGEREGSAFKRIMRPQGVALPVLASAAWVRLAADLQTIEETRVCIGPVGPVPTRITVVENALDGNIFSEDLLDEVVRLARENLKPRTSKYRATSEYRAEMIEVLLRRALPLAVKRARTGEVVPEGLGL
ncbi:MAG TPA: FAD binding domain-containing protein [Aggregatilineales bacterium]|nr:FAD binding domain-containing protein [Aggregatilineales bacterium]